MKTNLFNIFTQRSTPSLEGSSSRWKLFTAAMAVIGITAIGYYLTTKNPSPSLLGRVSPIPIAAESLPLTEEERLNNLLDQWMDNSLAEGNKAKAITLIKQAFQEKSTSLNLNGLNLTLLPEEVFCFLPSLTWLNLSRNQLTTLTLSPGSLPSLAWLNLSGNQLTTLTLPPGSLPSLTHLYLSGNQLTTFTLPPDSLPSLTELYLSGNQLTTFTLPPGSLPSLTHLNLGRNQLTTFTLPPGSLPSLTWLNLSGNQHLLSVPMVLANCSTLTFIDYDDTQISSDTINAILSAAQVLRGEQSSNRLPSQLQLWCSYAGLDSNALNAVLNFSDTEKGHIAEWLHRLAGTKDFQHCQTELAQKVCGILKDASNPEFKELFIDQIAANNAACGDRAAMGLNEIYVSWKILLLPDENPLQEKLKTIVGVAKTVALRKTLTAIMEAAQQNDHVSLDESTEIYLYYETLLAQTLGLETAIQLMLYAQIGQRAWINLDVLKDGVQSTYLDEVMNLPVFERLVEQDETLQNKLAEIQHDFDGQLETLEENSDDYYQKGQDCQIALANQKKDWLTANLSSI